jgi:hypothetical protein
VHGALHPSKLFVTDEATEVIAGTGGHAPYAAPEVIAGHGATPLSDQYSLAAITFEWMFGRPLTHAGDRPIEVRSMPGVDRPALSKAFTRALAPKPEDRFASCTAFCDALAGAVVPELPLLADVDDFAAEPEAEPDPDLDPSPISAEDLAPFDSERENAFLAQGGPIAVPIETEPESEILARDEHPDFDEIAPLPLPPPAGVASWNPSATAPAPRTMESPRFGPVALFVALIVGAVAGFAAGYMAVPRALQSGPPQTFATAPDSKIAVSAESKSAATEAPKVSAPKAPEAPKALEAPKTSKAAEKAGRLLVRSTPSGASVSVDGVAKGETPIALRDLDMGTRSVTIAQRGYKTETRKVSISKTRPARTLDVRLVAGSQPAAAKPTGGSGAQPAAPKLAAKGASGGGPATVGKPAGPTGTLAVESRPVGASVTINGKPSGATPITINDLEPGEYRILMTMPGYRNFATTVRVVAGERARAAASLTAVEQ